MFDPTPGTNIIERFDTKKEAEAFVRENENEHVLITEKIRVQHQYHVTYDRSHGKYYETRHERVFAYNAKEACKIVMDNYYEALNDLYARRGTCRNAAAHGVRYPFHLHAERMD